MNLLKIGDDPLWEKIIKKIAGRMADLASSPEPQMMTNLKTSLVSDRARKSQIEVELSAMNAKEGKSAWAAAKAGDGNALEARDRLRTEYGEIEKRERFAESAIEEGRLELDWTHGKVSLDVCNEIRPDYLKSFVPKARAAARQMLEAMEVEQRFINLLTDHDVRTDHLQRVYFPLSRERLELFLRETAELG